MENTPQNEDEVTAPKMNVLFEVTTLSKTLAAIVFITLPFVGFWFGLNYNENYSIDYFVNKYFQGDTNSPQDIPWEDVFEVPINDVLFHGEKTGYTTDEVLVYFSRDDIFGQAMEEERILIEDADASMFRVIVSEPNDVGSLYAVDAYHIYAYDKTLLGNPYTVRVFGRGNAFLASDSGVYLFGNLIAKLSSNTDFEIYNDTTSDEFPQGAYGGYLHKLSDDTWFEYGFFRDSSSERTVFESRPLATKPLDLGERF